MGKESKETPNTEREPDEVPVLPTAQSLPPGEHDANSLEQLLRIRSQEPLPAREKLKAELLTNPEYRKLYLAILAASISPPPALSLEEKLAQRLRRAHAFTPLETPYMQTAIRTQAAATVPTLKQKVLATILPETPYADATLSLIWEEISHTLSTIKNRIQVTRVGTLRTALPEREGLITEAFKKGEIKSQIAFNLEELGALLLHIMWEVLKTAARTTKNIVALVIAGCPYILTLLIKTLTAVMFIAVINMRSGDNRKKNKKIDTIFHQLNKVGNINNPAEIFKKLLAGIFMVDTFIPIASTARKDTFIPHFDDLSSEYLIATQNFPFSVNRNKVFWQLVPETFTTNLHPNNVLHTSDDNAKDREITLRRKRIDYAIQRLNGNDIRAVFNTLRDCTSTEKLNPTEIETEFIKVLERENVRTKRNQDALQTLREELPDLACAMATRNFQVLQAQRLLGMYPKITRIKKPKKIGQASPDRWLFDIEDKDYGGKDLDITNFLQRMKLIDYRHSPVHDQVETLLRVKGIEKDAATMVRVALMDNNKTALRTADRNANNYTHYRADIMGTFEELATQHQAARSKEKS